MPNKEGAFLRKRPGKATQKRFQQKGQQRAVQKERRLAQTPCDKRAEATHEPSRGFLKDAAVWRIQTQLSKAGTPKPVRSLPEPESSSPPRAAQDGSDFFLGVFPGASRAGETRLPVLVIRHRPYVKYLCSQGPLACISTEGRVLPLPGWLSTETSGRPGLQPGSISRHPTPRSPSQSTISNTFFGSSTTPGVSDLSQP